MSVRFDPDPDLLTSPLPAVLWIELTSRCPFDCIFCSRRLRRGEGQHMDRALFSSIIDQLQRPEIIRLNYSGESIHYPHLVEAVRMSKEAGARTELVTALASISSRLLRELAESGLDRLTVSLHTLDPVQYRELYRFGSLEELLARIRELHRWKEERHSRMPEVDLAFVAMAANLEQLLPVVEYARDIGCPQVSVCPVIRRDPIPFVFAEELEGSRLRKTFRNGVREAIRAARRRCPGIRITSVDVEDAEAGTRPPQAGEGPDFIRTCEQNPWETMHILADGTVVACEVMDGIPIGNLRRQSLAEVWHGGKYREFRRSYRSAAAPSCSECTWKTMAGPVEAGRLIDAAGGDNAQLLRGWYAPDESGTSWAKQQAWAVLGNLPPATKLRLRGLLVPTPGGGGNRLEVRCAGSVIGEVCNLTSRDVMFDACFPLPPTREPHLLVQVETACTLCPAEAGTGSDSRRLAFALHRLELL